MRNVIYGVRPGNSLIRTAREAYRKLQDRFYLVKGKHRVTTAGGSRAVFYLLCPAAGERSTLSLPLALDTWVPAVPACCSRVPGATTRGSSPLAAPCREGGKAASGVPAPDAAPPAPRRQRLHVGGRTQMYQDPRSVVVGQRDAERRTCPPAVLAGRDLGRTATVLPPILPEGATWTGVAPPSMSQALTGTRSARRRLYTCSPVSTVRASQTWCPVSGLPTPGDGA